MTVNTEAAIGLGLMVLNVLVALIVLVAQTRKGHHDESDY